MKSKSAMDEVEELLKAAENKIVLKLKVDSHISRSSPSYLELDLEHRFQALKKPSSSSSSKTNKPVSNSQLPQPLPQRTITDAKSVQSFQDDDDLYARFAALKGISSSSSSSSIPPARFDSGGVQIDHLNGKKNDDDDDDVDEVEKIIQWAIDAACLDPSPPTDDEDGDDDDDSEDDDDDDSEDDDDDDSEDERVKGSKKGKNV